MNARSDPGIPPDGGQESTREIAADTLGYFVEPYMYP
jgi:hypothetical protein